MYDKTVTLFIKRANGDSIVWFPYVLSNVDLNENTGVLKKKYGESCTDNAELHVRYVGTALDPQINGYAWKAPKQWEALTDDEISASITFKPGDFFYLGTWANGEVPDKDYRNGFYQHMNKNADSVYLITSVSCAYTVIKHFEILGK